MTASVASSQTSSGSTQSAQGASLASGQDTDANIAGAAPRGGSEFGAERPNLGSARSDYGALAYGGSLDESGGGKGVDDFAQGRVDRGSRGDTPLRGEGRSQGVSAGGGNSVWVLLAGVGIGAGLMYLLDPAQGGRRRALLRAKLAGAVNDIGDAASSKARDLKSRAQGVVAEARRAVQDSAESGGATSAGSASRQGQQGGSAGGSGNRTDEVGGSGVYPVSSMAGASPDARVHGEMSFGQGERGAAGYYDSGGSELSYSKEHGVLGGASPGESGAYKPQTE